MGEPAVALFWGTDPFLLREEAHALLARFGARAKEVDGTDWRSGETADLATPSLWGERRALLVQGCQGLPEAGLRELRGYIQGPSPDALCVLTLVSGAKSPPPLARAVQEAGGSVRQVALKRQELPAWLVARARTRRLQLSPPGAVALVGTLGEETAALDQALEQLASAFGDRPVGPAEVRSQFEGLGEQRVWDLCDQAFLGRLPQALVSLRSLLEAREDPLMILGGIASRVRDLLRVRSLPERLPPAEAARAAGLRFDWQLRRYREQARRLSMEELTALHRRVTEADRALKSGASGDVILPPLLATMAGHPEAALDVPIRVSR